MKRTFFACFRLMTCAILVLAISGCMSVPNTPNPRFYTLKPISENQGVEKFNITPNIIMAVGPVRIPEYLKRPQIVTWDKNGMLTFAQLDRWGEPLDIAFSRLISSNLMVLLNGVNMESYPWNIAVPVKYQVAVDFMQLESELDKDLFFVTQWSIIDAQNNKMVLTKRYEFRGPIKPHSYLGLAETLSSACVSLSLEIAKVVASLETQAEIKEESVDSNK